MKDIKARTNSGDDWKTPDDFYKSLDTINHFDFDPCPNQADFDGLQVEWGQHDSMQLFFKENKNYGN